MGTPRTLNRTLRIYGYGPGTAKPGRLRLAAGSDERSAGKLPPPPRVSPTSARFENRPAGRSPLKSTTAPRTTSRSPQICPDAPAPPARARGRRPQQSAFSRVNAGCTHQARPPRKRTCGDPPHDQARVARAPRARSGRLLTTTRREARGGAGGPKAVGLRRAISSSRRSSSDDQHRQYEGHSRSHLLRPPGAQRCRPTPVGLSRLVRATTAAPARQQPSHTARYPQGAILRGPARPYALERPVFAGAGEREPPLVGDDGPGIR